MTTKKPPTKRRPGGKKKPRRKPGEKGPAPKQPPKSKRPRGFKGDAKQAWTKERIERLCAHLRENGHLGAAAKSVGSSKRNVIAKRQKDEHFDALVHEAEIDAQLTVIQLIRKLGIEGVLEPIYQGGQLVGTRRVWNTKAMEMEARRLVPEYREHAKLELSGDPERPVAVKADLSGLSDEELWKLREIAEKVKSSDGE